MYCIVRKKLLQNSQERPPSPVYETIGMATKGVATKFNISCLWSIQTLIQPRHDVNDTCITKSSLLKVHAICTIIRNYIYIFVLAVFIVIIMFYLSSLQ